MTLTALLVIGIGKCLCKSLTEMECLQALRRQLHRQRTWQSSSVERGRRGVF